MPSSTLIRNNFQGGTASVPLTRMQMRVDTLANWTSSNPVLLAGEIGRESDTGVLRVGDGSTAFLSLAGTRQSQDPYFNQVRLLLHGDGTNGAAGAGAFVDSSSYGWTHAALTGTTQISTTSPKYGTGAMSFGNTSSDFVQFGPSALFDPVGVRWTIEFWGYLNNTTGIKVFYEATAAAATSESGPLLYVNGTTIVLRASGDVNSTIAVAATTWNHYAIVHDGTNVKLYQDGVLGATSTPTGTAKQYFTIGNQASKIAPLNGKIDDFRYTIGVARYLSAFTAPTLPYPNS